MLSPGIANLDNQLKQVRRAAAAAIHVNVQRIN
jgi:hypothetical protein